MAESAHTAPEGTPTKPEATPLRLVYLYTTFPSLSETFLQREMRVMLRLPIELQLFSLWGGSRRFEGKTIRRFRLPELFLLLYWLPYWCFHRKKSMGDMLLSLFRHPPRYFKNFLETFVGLSFALIHAKRISQQKPHLMHAVWATMPATAAWAIHQLTGIPFSMGGHAYDIFQKGGDCLLDLKIKDALFIHSSTAFARTHLISKGALPDKVQLIRRGLFSFPPQNPIRHPLHELHLLSIGRLVEKKGYLDQLLIYRDLRKRGIAFRARIIGDGPLMKVMKSLIEDYGLQDRVQLVGKIPHEDVQEHYEWADLFLFTGVIASNGDRNGLANVIPEALSRGIPVITTPDAGILENFKDKEELLILPLHPITEWVDAIKTLIADKNLRQSLAQKGRLWTETHFNARQNSAKLHARMRQEAGLPAAPEIEGH
jgi:glycosyltransferase involved in cell wall biosynthesis